MPRSRSPQAALEGVEVGDVMRPGVITCLPDDGVAAIASTMATGGVHAVVIFPIDLPSPPVVTDLELARAALERPSARALEMAREPVPVVNADAPLTDAISLMSERCAAHVLITAANGMVAGMVSSFDVAALLGGHEPRYARTLRPRPARPSPSATALSTASVADAMHRGVVTCPPDAPLGTVARSMAEFRVHCVVLSDSVRNGGKPGWSMVSDMDLVMAINRGVLDQPASAMASTSPISVDESDFLDSAARLMVEHDTSHVVVRGESGLPSGIVSTLDVASILAATA